MPEVPEFDFARNVRDLLIEYGAARWPAHDLNELLEWVGLEPVPLTRSHLPSHQKARQAKSARVYVLMEDYPGSLLIKVGISYSPRNRCLDLEKQVDRNLSVAFFTIPYARRTALAIERAAHAALHQHREGHEWFSCGLGVAVQAVLQAGGHPHIEFEDII